MSESFAYILFVISIFIIVSPVYLQRRKLWRMADEDLKQVDYEEWKKQIKSNAYIRAGSRVIWGLFLLSAFIINFQEITEAEFDWESLTVFVSGIGFIVWSILGFRLEMKKISKIK